MRGGSRIIPIRASLVLLVLAFTAAHLPAPPVCLADVRQLEQQRIDMIAKASRSVVCILTPDKTSGGSGVIISEDGYGLTNFHVVMGMLGKKGGFGALADGKTYPLQVLGIDPTGDLAMFHLTGRDRFDPAPLGDSDSIRVGDSVVALGNPFMLAEDYTPTATFGIISGLQRYQFGADARSLVYTDCIQIDASINPGNSGGPLFDMQGNVIGINGRASFKTDDPLRQRVNVGVAYAITINQAKRFMPALKQGWLVEHGTLDATVADSPAGVVFDNVLRSSAAERAGIEIGDRLAAFDGRPIASANAFASIIGVYPAGWPVTITYRRGDQEFHREIDLDSLALTRETSFRKADPAWIRGVAKGTTPTTLPFDVATLTKTVEPVATDKLIASLMPAVVKIYGGRIGGQRGYATGVIVSPDGEVITPLSLLLEASDVRIVTADGQLHSAEVKHRDDYRQLALLKMRDITAAPSQASPHPALSLDESVSPATGDAVFVVGNPFKIADGDEPCSVTRGIISGRVRLDASQPGGTRPIAYRGEVLIMDAMASNTGSPGSAVFDTKGQWIGLVGEVAESRLTNTLLNYAYPVQELAAFLRDARVTSTAPAPVVHADAGPGYHGIKLSRIGYRQKLPFIESVAKNSPAARAGAQAGDLIISANNRPVPASRAFDEICSRLHAGEDLSLIVKRGEQLVTLRFTLEEVPK